MSLRRSLVALALALLWGAPVAAQTYQGGASASATDATPTLSYTTTAGRLLVSVVTVNDSAGTTTCTPPTGWTELTDEAVFGNYRLCVASKLAAGSDAMSWTLSASASWALGVVEFSGLSSATPTDSGTADENSTTPTVSSGGTAASGDLVIATLIDTYDATLTGPSGYTSLTLSPASGLHYGQGFVAMGAIAYRTAPSSGAQTATWGQTDGHFTGLGIYTFAVSGGGGATPCLLTLLGAGKCGA